MALAATAADSDGTLSRVEFYAGNVLVATATTAPYTAMWPVSVAGSYAITAKAFDNLGASTVSGSVTVTVGDGVTYLHNDFAGSPIAATDGSGAVIWKENFLPYGGRLNNQAAAAGNRQWFHGKAVDGDTGLSYMGARYYDPDMGRFMGIDAVGFTEGNVHSFNRYAYANDNPLRFTDPDGREPQPVIVKGSPQITGTWGHDLASAKIGEALMASGNYTEVHYHRSLAQIANDVAAGGQKPDVAGVHQNGGIHTYEIPSNSQTEKSQVVKGIQMQEKLAAIGKAGEAHTVSVAEALSGRFPVRAIGGLSIFSAGIRVIDLRRAQKANPNLSVLEGMNILNGTSTPQREID